MADDEDAFQSAKTRANNKVREGLFNESIELYSAALDVATDQKQRAVVLANRAHAFLSAEPPRPDDALRDASQAVMFAPRYAKAHYRLSKALAATGHAPEAAEAMARSKALSKSVIDSDEKPGPNAFKMEEELGEGNFSKVYRAIHKPSGEVFALKVMEKSKIGQLKRRHPNIHNEVQMEKLVLNRLNEPNGPGAPHERGHPGIVRLYHTFQDAMRLYFLMAYEPGTELWSLMLHDGKLVGMRPSLAKHCLAQVVMALEHLRKKNVVHRDLKPENVIVLNSGRVVLVDFGTSRDLAPGAKLNGPSFVGTAEYMSPEVVANSKDVRTEADLWALGCMVYQASDGDSPFKGGSQYLTHLKTQRGLRNGHEFPPQASKETRSLVQALCMLRPQDRIGSETGSGTVDADAVVALPVGAEASCTPSTASAEGKGFHALRSHPYFAGIEFSKVHTQPLPVATDNEARTQGLRDWLVRRAAHLRGRRSEEAGLGDAAGDPPPEALQTLTHTLRNELRHFLLRMGLLAPPYGARIHAMLFPSDNDGDIDGASCSFAVSASSRFDAHMQRSLMSLPYWQQRVWRGPFHFAVLADLQFGRGQDGQVTQAETTALRRALVKINALRPRFVVILGELAMAPRGAPARKIQLSKVRHTLLALDDSIPLVTVCGEKSFAAAGNSSASGDGDGGCAAGVWSAAAAAEYGTDFGADYFGFWCSGVRCIVLNSALMRMGGVTDESPGEAHVACVDQNDWLDSCIDESKLNSHYSLVFAHRPWFTHCYDEADIGDGAGARMPLVVRQRWLARLREGNVDALFGVSSSALAVGEPLPEPERVPAEGDLFPSVSQKMQIEGVGNVKGSGSDDDLEDNMATRGAAEGCRGGMQAIGCPAFFSAHDDDQSFDTDASYDGVLCIVKALDDGVRQHMFRVSELPGEMELPKSRHADAYET